MVSDVAAPVLALLSANDERGVKTEKEARHKDALRNKGRLMNIGNDFLGKKQEIIVLLISVNQKLNFLQKTWLSVLKNEI